MKLRVMISLPSQLITNQTATTKFGVQLHTISGIGNCAAQRMNRNHKEPSVTASALSRANKYSCIILCTAYWFTQRCHYAIAYRTFGWRAQLRNTIDCMQFHMHSKCSYYFARKREHFFKHRLSLGFMLGVRSVQRFSVT